MKAPSAKNGRPPVDAPNFLPQTAEVIIVDERVNFEGNIIPHAWLRRITTENGRTDAIACMVLAEIVYWYRGADVINNGKVIGRKRKFSSDYLQKSYADLAAKLNLTKGQVKAAMDRLEKKDLVKRDFRTIYLRGVKTSNVLFIQLFAWELVKISNVPGAKMADLVDENDERRYGENSGDLPENFEGAYPDATDTSGGPVADKYKEYAKDHPADHSPGEETSASAESAEPTPPDSFRISEDNTGMLSPEPGRMRSGDRQETPIRNPVAVPDASPARQSDINDVKRIRPVLEHAFGGQKFSDRDEKILQSYIAEGRITLPWAEALKVAKTGFDQDRARYKAENVFIPVRPSYVIRDFDRTTDGILSILNEQYINLERDKSEYCSEDLDQYFHLFRGYDYHFKQIHRGEEVNGQFIVRPGHEDEFAALLIDQRLFVHYAEGDPVPPAWLRIIYAHQRGVYGDRLRLTLLKKAQSELQANPTGLQALPEPLSDEQIKTLFELDASALRNRWENESPQWEAMMDKLQTLIAAVTEIKALDDDAASLIGI